MRGASVNSNSEIKVFLVEDHPVMRLGLKMMLEEKGFAVCGEAESLDETLRLLPKSSADIAIFDLSINGDTAFSVLEQIRLWLPEIRLIIYSMHDSPLFVDNAMNLGANAYVSKADPVEILVDAINSVMAGNKFFGPSIKRALEARFSGGKKNDSTVKNLSMREMEVLTDLGQGLSRSEIAAKLGIGVRTVETYIQRLKQKLGVELNRELIREAIKITHSG